MIYVSLAKVPAFVGRVAIKIFISADLGRSSSSSALCIAITCSSSGLLERPKRPNFFSQFFTTNLELLAASFLVFCKVLYKRLQRAAEGRCRVTDELATKATHK